MRPIAVIGLGLLLSGCAYVSNPFAGFPHYIADTHGLTTNPNAPQGNSETMRRVRGEAVTMAPLHTEPGNVWPAPVKAEPTLQYYERQLQDGTLSPQSGSAGPATSSSTPPGATATPIPLTMPAGPKPIAPPPATLGKVTPVNGSVTTPQGVAHLSTDANGVITYTFSNGTKGIAVSNGNGTLTLIGPDGSVQTVNAPK